MSAASENGYYGSDREVVSLAERLIDRSLPKPEWTHEAHCAAALYFIKERPDLDLAKEMPDIIRRYNQATGTANTDSSGYHETITQFYIEAVRDFVAKLPASVGLSEACNQLIVSPYGSRTFAFAYYSKARLFSAEARRVWPDPDLKPLGFTSAIQFGDN